ncbi:MAG TPA: zinc ribbon domain-containing protein [Candidatus Hydrogenedentes bacterium]|nr:zinc ribbon domain-containing protein [Candidatus Hydrogenedentota bacterium]
MPTYTYKCVKCSHEMDVFHGMTEKPRVKCTSCGSTQTKRLLGTGAGLIFKGSGFYETDYKKNGKRSADTSASQSKSNGKSESKAESSAQKSGAKTKSSDAS